MRTNNNGDSPEVKALIANITAIDKENNAVLKSILKQYGFPGYKVAGIEGSDNFWLLAQHQDEDTAFQNEVLALMKKSSGCQRCYPI